MDNDDLGVLGGVILALAGLLFFFNSHIEKIWPYCLGGALFGLALIVASRVLPDRGE
jgi:hypothetical protein